MWLVITLLIIVNLPIYMGLGWILFDSKESAADTFFETLVSLLMLIAFGWIGFLFVGGSDQRGAGPVTVFTFLTASVFITGFQFVLLLEYGWVRWVEQLLR